MEVRVLSGALGKPRKRWAFVCGDGIVAFVRWWTYCCLVVARRDHVAMLVGRVQGLVIDPSDHHVTHILLDEGHPWGKKRVAIPISAVKRLGPIIRLNLTEDEVRDLPPIDVHSPD